MTNQQELIHPPNLPLPSRSNVPLRHPLGRYRPRRRRSHRSSMIPWVYCNCHVFVVFASVAERHLGFLIRVMLFAGRTRTGAEVQLNRRLPEPPPLLPISPRCTPAPNWVSKDVEKNSSRCFEISKKELQQFRPFSSLRWHWVCQGTDGKGVVDS